MFKGGRWGDGRLRALKEVVVSAASGSTSGELIWAVGTVALGLEAPAECAERYGVQVSALLPFAPDGRARRSVELSVVVPAFEEGSGLRLLWERLAPVLDRFGDTEVIIVDDGSTDATWAVICELADTDERIKGIRLSRNYGQQSALTAGLEASTGQVVACIDADLQDPPELLEEMAVRWRSGAEVVYAVRSRRQGSLPRRAAYKLFYRVYRRLADIDVPVDSGDFALLDRRVVDHLVALPERTRFLRGLRTWVGFRQEAFPYDRPERVSGTAKYSLRKLVRLALDGLISLSSLPLRVASVLGVLTAFAGAVYIGIAIAARLLVNDVPEGWTSTIAVILVLGGAQLTVIGVLGEYIARIYDEVKRRPHFLVRERTGRRHGP